MSKKTVGYVRYLHWYAVFTAFCTLILLVAGALVTGTGSGLAVPDWPLSFGQYFPEMVGGVLYEHGHRMIAGTVGILTFILSAVTFFAPVARWKFYLSLGAVVAVIVQALLGGLTVILRLPPQVSVAHACLGQLFFCLMISFCLVTSRWWNEDLATLSDSSFFSMRHHALLLSIAFFVQLLMGATMRHLGAGLAIPDFPLAFGQVIPPLVEFSVVIHFAHRVGAFVLTALVIWFVTRVYKHHFESLALVGGVGVLISFVAVQLVLGALTIWLARPVWVTTFHLALGASCFATSVALTVMCFRLFQPSLRENRVGFETAQVAQ